MSMIKRMAKRHYEALSAGLPTLPWDQLSEAIQDAYYDAMWAALEELRVPTDGMLEAALRISARASATVRHEYALGRHHEARKIKMSDRWTAAIDHLREIK